MSQKVFQRFPKAYQAYPAILKGFIFSQVDKLKKKKQPRISHLPESCYSVENFHVDKKHLQQFLQICGFYETNHNHQHIPAIYLAVLSQSLQMQMMSLQAFPFDVLGLVHIANNFKQYRLVNVDETLSLSCRFGEMTAHEKGTAFNFIVDIQVQNQTVIQATSTYLARHKVAESTSKIAIPEQTNHNLTIKNTWYLSENLGRRYAMISGDFNLIHLHAKTAQLFGFKRAIAHGMWTNAKVLAQLSLPEAYEFDVQFKVPIFLPSKVEFLSSSDQDTSEILVRSQDTHKPHLVAQLRKI